MIPESDYPKTGYMYNLEVLSCDFNAQGANRMLEMARLVVTQDNIFEIVENVVDQAARRNNPARNSNSGVAHSLLGELKSKTRKAALTGLLAGSAVLAPSVGWSDNSKSTQQDAVLTGQFLACDAQAEQQAAQVSTLTPISPASVLAPFVLLGQLKQRQQQEANQPLLLEQIEQQRQQCRKNVVAAATRRAQEVLDQNADEAKGYKRISIEAFMLDAKSLAASQARVSLVGAYVPDGNFEWFFARQTDVLQATAGAANIPKIPLLTEDAKREFRQFLLRCKSSPGASEMGCLTVITGHVSLCSLSGPLGNGRGIPCVTVENGREVRQQ